MWFLIPVFAAAGAGLWELVRPAAKTEVILYTSNVKIIDGASKNLTAKGIDHDVFTDGVNNWISVKPADRPAAIVIGNQWMKAVEA